MFTARRGLLASSNAYDQIARPGTELDTLAGTRPVVNFYGGNYSYVRQRISPLADSDR